MNEARILAGLGYELPQMNGVQQEKIFFDRLMKNNIELNRKSLADLAIWEPKSYEALLKIAFSPIGYSDDNEKN